MKCRIKGRFQDILTFQPNSLVLFTACNVRGSQLYSDLFSSYITLLWLWKPSLLAFFISLHMDHKFFVYRLKFSYITQIYDNIIFLSVLILKSRFESVLNKHISFHNQSMVCKKNKSVFNQPKKRRKYIKVQCTHMWFNNMIGTIDAPLGKTRSNH